MFHPQEGRCPHLEQWSGAPSWRLQHHEEQRPNISKGLLPLQHHRVGLSNAQSGAWAGLHLILVCNTPSDGDLPCPISCRPIRLPSLSLLSCCTCVQWRQCSPVLPQATQSISLIPIFPSFSACLAPVCNGGMPSGNGSSSRWPLLGCSSCCQATLPVAADSSLPLHTPAATTTPRLARTLHRDTAVYSSVGRDQQEHCYAEYPSISWC
jgi:hypothetical protein